MINFRRFSKSNLYRNSIRYINFQDLDPIESEKYYEYLYVHKYSDIEPIDEKNEIKIDIN